MNTSTFEESPTRFMKLTLLSILVLAFLCGCARYVGPPKNVGREYGNPKMPLMVSHLAGANKRLLERVNRNGSHRVFGKILCFRKSCRIQAGHTSSLKAISFNKFRKKVARNAKKGLYKNVRPDSTFKRQPIVPSPIVSDSAVVMPVPIAKADSLIVLGAEVLFETNQSTLRSEHFGALNEIVEYLIQNPGRSVAISGHTDNTGSQSHNFSLSKRRADVVAEYLVINGVDISRVETFGLGSTKPIVPNTSAEGRKKNRRVELLIHDNR